MKSTPFILIELTFKTVLANKQKVLFAKPPLP